MSTAVKQGRLLVTRHRDFGNLVFVEALAAGVLYLRISPIAQDAVHGELARVLKRYTQAELSKAFVVVEARRHRIRRVR